MSGSSFLKKVVNIGTNSLKRSNFQVMSQKLVSRIADSKSNLSKDEVLAWCENKAESAEELMASLDLALWEETTKTCKDIEEKAYKKLSQIELDLGGGGHYYLLYFLVRYLMPSTVVETGVAAGWSSQAILSGLEKNENSGSLYSSDFPYFRYKNPEELVGFIVEDKYKDSWNLYIDGDQINLPKIIKKAVQINLFHYDSDKSYQGRSKAYEIVEPYLADDSVVVFDDIQDNAHFIDHVSARNCKFKVLSFNGKYLGILGLSQ